MSVANTFIPNLFKGKVFFCTGGAGTICRRQVEALVKLGASGAIIGRRKEIAEKAAKEITKEFGSMNGNRVIGLSADVRSVEELTLAVDKTVDEFKRLDYVIAGAAGNFLADVRHLSANAFKSVVSIDLLGSFNTAKATFPHLVKSGKEDNGGVGILFVSATLHYSGSIYQAHVSAAKAGIDALNKCLAVEWGPYGIRSNCIAPGPIGGTEGVARLLPTKSAINKAIKSIPLQKFGNIDDIANATCFLFSPAAKYISGTILVVDGGANLTQGSGIIPYPDGIINSDEIITSFEGKAKSKI